MEINSLKESENIKDLDTSVDGWVTGFFSKTEACTFGYNYNTKLHLLGFWGRITDRSYLPKNGTYTYGTLPADFPRPKEDRVLYRAMTAWNSASQLEPNISVIVKTDGKVQVNFGNWDFVAGYVQVLACTAGWYQ